MNSDLFLRAYSAARAVYGDQEWHTLPARERVAALYAELRRIDRANATTATAYPGRKSTAIASVER